MRIMVSDIVLNCAIYESSIIQQAVKAYSSFARIEFHRQNDYIVCTFYDCKYDKEITIKVFLNFLIDLSIQVVIVLLWV